jgi:hypothetical protein
MKTLELIAWVAVVIVGLFVSVLNGNDWDDDKRKGE